MADINFRKTPKPSAKGVKRQREIPLLYDQVKSKLNLSLTPTAKDNLTQKAIEGHTSISDMIERWSRNTCLGITLTPTTIAKLIEKAEVAGVSPDELIERWVRTWEDNK